MARSSYRRNARRDAELRAMIDDGVMAGAEVMAEAVRGKFEDRDLGYLHGEFATGEAANIQIDGPYTRRGVRRADVYSPAKREGEDGPAFYPAMWEFGHYNLWIDKTGVTFVRVETFAPALYENIGSIGGVMARAIRQSPFTGLTKKSGGIQTSVNLRDFGL